MSTSTEVRDVTGHWLGGERRHHDTGLALHEPRSGKTIGRVAVADAATVDDAVAIASSAWRTWRDVSLLKRQGIMFSFRDLLVRHEEDLATAIAREHGKTVDDARGEIARGIEVVEYACAIADHLKGEYSEQVATGIDTYSVRQPLGVCVGVTPFNFPVMVPLWMSPLAIACGNSFILKPSERDPSPSLLLAELYQEAGLPDGVFNVVQGDAATVNALITHPDVAAVSFVGSTPVAQAIYTAASSVGKRVQALGGAKNHLVVMPDADLDAAADAAISAAFGSSGQRCMAISVVVAVEPVADDLVSAIAERTRRLRVGDSFDPETDVGPVITAQQRDRLLDVIEQGPSSGATLVVDGRQFTIHGESGGFYVGPSVFDHVAPDMQLYDEELFGPILCVVRVRSLDAAIELINASPYGNGASIFTDSGTSARVFQREITAGMVGVNVPIPVPVSFYSFGGWKASLFGDRHIYGPEGVAFYTRGKVMTGRWVGRPGLDLGFRRED